jgi:hypothetical protein
MLVAAIVTKFLGRWGRGTGSWYVVRYLWETFTLRVENEPVNPGRGRRTRVEGRRWWTCFSHWCCWFPSKENWVVFLCKVLSPIWVAHLWTNRWPGLGGFTRWIFRQMEIILRTSWYNLYFGQSFWPRGLHSYWTWIVIVLPDHLCLGTKWGNSIVHMLCGFVLLFPELSKWDVPNATGMSCFVDD